MPRVEISFPEKSHFATELAVRIGDINYGNHLGHDRMITMMHEARLLFFQAMGYSEFDIEGVGTLIGDLAISYRNEAFYGDQLNFTISVQEISRKSCQFYYRISCAGNDASERREPKIIALAKTGVVFFDYELRKTAAVPSALIEQLDKNEFSSGA